MIKEFELNKYQLKAVNNEDKACLVNASVGSGKTSVLIAKIKKIICEKSVDLDKIVILTFTNKAANEIKERLASELGERIIELKYCGTFHSVALAMMENEFDIKELGFTRSPQVIEPYEEAELAQIIIEKSKYNIKYLNKIDKRIQLARSGKYMYANMKNKDDIISLMQEITSEKVAQNKLSFDDIIDHIVELTARRTFTSEYIIVDEFQDCDRQQLIFIDNMLGEKSKVFVVGDPSQIIYTWRGSKSNIFEEFSCKYNATELSLPLNYRSTQSILEVAKCVLPNNEKLEGVKDFGQKISIKKHFNAFYEASYLVQKVQELLEKGYEYKDISILYRLQKQSEQIEKIFEKNGIPFEVSLKKKINDVSVLKWFIKLIKCSINTDDISNMEYVLLDENYGVFSKKSEMRTELNKIGKSEVALVCKILNFEEWVNSKNCIDNIYEYFELNHLIRENSATFAEDKNNVTLLISKIIQYVKESDKSTFDSLTHFSNSAALYGIDVLFDKENISANKVKLNTIHASKGLEYKCVFIIGANYGSIPMRGKTSADEDEEKRLFFVAITRAKEMLEISYYTSPDDSRMIGGRSHFLSYIPARLVRDDIKKIDTQHIRNMVKEIAVNIAEEPKVKRCRHVKYGEGNIISSDDEVTIVNFDNYGEKSFVTMFYEVEEL